jgi:hypothetical protein
MATLCSRPEAGDHLLEGHYVPVGPNRSVLTRLGS